MADYKEGRNEILRALKEELVGPSPQGREIDCAQPIAFEDQKQSYGPWRQKGSGEEILSRDAPCKRYGIGVLYPIKTQFQDTEQESGKATFRTTEETTETNQVTEAIITDTVSKAIERIENRTIAAIEENASNDFDLSSANSFRPSSMGISFLAEIPQNANLTVEINGGCYKEHTIKVAGKERKWWLRSPISFEAKFEAAELCTLKEVVVQRDSSESPNMKGLKLQIEVLSRPFQTAQKRLLTVCLINRMPASDRPDASSLFQTHFKVSIQSPEKLKLIHPYPNLANDSTLSSDEEEQSLSLLYRKATTFAVGHGCAADWESPEGAWQRQLSTITHNTEKYTISEVSWVSAECLPSIEIPSITPDITRSDGSPVNVSMAQLAGLIPNNDGFEGLSEVISLYEQWIEQKVQEIPLLQPKLRFIAKKHMDICNKCVQRMRQGHNYLKQNKRAKRAFELTNFSILLQQLRSRREPRKTTFDAEINKYIFSESYSKPDPMQVIPGRGQWRAFQIAFLLMSIQSTVDETDPDREIVELIWFPTGGGKTEAYFGLTAFAIFMRRLRDKEDTGVHVLMRYTLRLLTAQQFQRASGLICAMEYLRRLYKQELGEQEISIGIWLGSQTTPNTRKDAVDTLKKLRKKDPYTENKFILNKCPWCQAQFGPINIIKAKNAKKSSSAEIAGYEHQGDTVIFACPDNNCTFKDKLPIYVVDEDIYEKRPSLLIGTVDKFALVAWKPEVRNIFGIAQNGSRYSSPPGLIIQDELHLISGPLGSMVGLYETIIEELCTDRRNWKVILPKIISSTATIRRYEEQIKKLYARDKATLFPPPGLSADDSFFARYATDSDGKLERGRIFLGVHAPGLSSLQTAQVRSFTALLQSPLALPDNQRDPWWTLLLFFNSLRELGTTLSLFQSDIPDYFRVLMNRKGLEFSQIRKFWNVLELTGRLRSDEVPEAISKLEIVYKQDGQKERPVDACLASNIIEVGVDIDRLSLMAVVGQPKTTSQYIQVTGRVGRKWNERPGLVVTIYTPTKPRDRSHFEKFRSYHERLYAQVEPTSVTPFSPPVLDRALHAIMVSFVRQIGDKNTVNSPYPYPKELIDQVEPIILKRIEAVAPEEMEDFKLIFKKRIKEWQQWQRQMWEDSSGEKDALLRYAGSYVTPEQSLLSWATPSSMRDVDAQCEAIITSLYAMLGDKDSE